ncbi:MAG: phosphatase PAP2 family protein [Candidatus Woesearchaeota archaeon]
MKSKIKLINFFEDKFLKIFSIGFFLTLILFFLDNYFINLILKLQNRLLLKIFYYITLIGNLELFILIVLFISFVFYFRKKKIWGLWFSLLASLVLSFLMKIFFNRLRPFEEQNIIPLINTSLSSFPSGHSMIVFSALPFLIKNFPRQKYYFILIAVLVAFSRYYLFVHYLSDIVAGAFLGYIIGMFFSEMEDKNFNMK